MTHICEVPLQEHQTVLAQQTVGNEILQCANVLCFFFSSNLAMYEHYKQSIEYFTFSVTSWQQTWVGGKMVFSKCKKVVKLQEF